MAVDEFTKYLATLGVGGVLAGIMFMFYRKDVRMYTDLWKAQTELMMKVVQENTASNTKLSEQSAAQARLVEMMMSLVQRIPATQNAAVPPPHSDPAREARPV